MDFFPFAKEKRQQQQQQQQRLTSRDKNEKSPFRRESLEGTLRAPHHRGLPRRSRRETGEKYSRLTRVRNMEHRRGSRGKYSNGVLRNNPRPSNRGKRFYVGK